MFVMTNDHPTEIHTFRFGSGQVLSLTHRIIQQIPYLDGLVSFAQHSPTAFDADGHLTLDSNIDFNHFRIIIKTLPFQSLSQAIIRLPQNEDVAAILILMDYLGLLPAPYPTLDEIDSTFLFTLDNYRRDSSGQCEVEVTVAQNMAAHFVFVLARGECDEASDHVIAQIRWCAMFITRADRFFHPTLRHRVHMATEKYLLPSCPSLAPSLKPVPCEEEADTERIKFCIVGPIGVGKSTMIGALQGIPFSDDDISFVHRGFKEWDIPDTCESMINAVSNEIFDALETKIWQRCVNGSCDLSVPIAQSEPSLSRIRQLHRMNNEQIKRDVLLEIFEDLSVQTRIRHAITERMPTHVRDMEQEYRSKLQSIRHHQRDVETKLAERRWVFWTRRCKEREVSGCKSAIDKCEKKLQELGDLDRIMAKTCQSVLTNVYSFGIHLIRESVLVRYAIPQLKEKEQMMKKRNRSRMANFKMTDKAQKEQHRFHKQHPQLPMKQHRCRH